MLLLLTLWAVFKRGQIFTLGVLCLLQRALEQFRGQTFTFDILSSLMRRIPWTHTMIPQGAA